MRKISLNELKEIQIQILDEVVSFCNKNNIQYFLMAGTLLGAIRHKGYIPWDDDIDIGMLREDYNRFLYLYMKETGDYYIYSNKVNKNSTFPFIKICLKNTLTIDYKMNNNESYGINIDIFPIDSIRNINAVKKIRRLVALRNLKVIKHNLKSPKSILKYLIYFILKPIRIERLFKKIDRIIFQENQGKAIKAGNILWGYGEKELVNPDIFNSFIDVSFEGKVYQAPIGYDEWLSSVYGNYMEFPPVEKRLANHNFDAFVEVKDNINEEK